MGKLPALDAELERQAGPREPPQVLVRTFATPPGLPWVQAQAAQLEARHGSPLPIADLLFKLRRLDAWSPASPGRYAVFYVRRRDFVGAFETQVDVDGKMLPVAFGAAGDRLARLRTAGLICAAALAALLFVGAPATLALSARAEAEGALGLVEQRLAGKARQAERLEQTRRRSRALQAAVGEARFPAEVLADLAWLGRAKAPEARLVAVHWDHGLMALESRGEAPPIVATDRRLVRADRPVRPGVWVWGVDRPKDIAPVAAEIVR